MDEYLFIELAKLQADRRRLEREQREALRESSSEERGSIEGHREPVRRQWFAAEWRQQS
jgi:hypothetical protein